MAGTPWGSGWDHTLSQPAPRRARAKTGQRLSRPAKVLTGAPPRAAARQGPASSRYWTASSCSASGPLAATVRACPSATRVREAEGSTPSTGTACLARSATSVRTDCRDTGTEPHRRNTSAGSWAGRDTALQEGQLQRATLCRLHVGGAPRVSGPHRCGPEVRVRAGCVTSDRCADYRESCEIPTRTPRGGPAARAPGTAGPDRGDPPGEHLG